MTRNIVGAVVTGADFYGRQRELLALESEGLKQDILLLAPRRVGKSSLLTRFAENAESRRYRAVLVSVEDARGELDFFNDFMAMRIGPFEPEVASGLLAALADNRQIQLNADLRSRMLDKVGWLIPYHIQALFQCVEELVSERRTPASPGLIDAAFERLLAKHVYFNDWSERLTRELGRPLDEKARSLLNACARDPAGATLSTLDQTIAKLTKNPNKRETQLRFLLDVLTNDGYLRLENFGGEQRYSFRSPLLRAFWLRRYAR